VRAMGDWDDLVPAGLPAAALPTFYKDTLAYAIARLPKAPLFEGAREVLEQLRAAGKQLGVVTAADRSVIETILKEHDLAEAFDVVVSGSDIERQKPHPEGVLLALRQLGTEDTAQAVMLGDTDRDLHAAAQAGIDSILFHPDNAHTEVEHITKDVTPVAILRSWQEFKFY
jgi:HAD superfamily hydrolase (TIGR01509 family)